MERPVEGGYLLSVPQRCIAIVSFGMSVPLVESQSVPSLPATAQSDLGHKALKTLRAAVADPLGRPTRAGLTAARRVAQSLVVLGRARVLRLPGADADANAGDRNYLDRPLRHAARSAALI